MSHKPLTVAVAHALALALAAGPLSAQTFPLTITDASTPLRVEQVLTGLSIPWGIAMLPDDQALLTERPGTLSLVDLKAGTRSPVSGVPAVAAVNQGGLLDVALHPQYPNQNWVYLCYSVAIEGGSSTRLARYSLQDQALTNEEILHTGVPALRSGHHFGCRIQFDGKGHVFFSIGDRGERDLAQKLDNDSGKIHRLKDDGAVPADNPFVDQPQARPSIWSYGHRNPQGLRFRPGSTELWSHEHGPRGGDEINLVERGRNYGWPVITFGREYHGPKIGVGTAQDGMEQPALQWTPSIGPSGMIFYDSDRIPGWRGSILSGAMALTHLNRVTLDGTRAHEAERVFEGRSWRIRDVEQDAEGRIYLLTDNGWLLRVDRAE